MVPPSDDVVAPSELETRTGRYEIAIFAMMGSCLVFVILNILLTLGTISRMNVIPYVTDGSVYGCAAKVLAPESLLPTRTDAPLATATAPIVSPLDIADTDAKGMD